ncbi:MFS transporter [Adlercreutzia sp. ZJ154]|uniref:MFS transporter n=1 Tax=Adlercreutzia sp. ZJ154 TaxID=2709790 RepID=UPI0013ED680F|nr:MFS transporter [Adlercreutzia sp. ZJ154]
MSSASSEELWTPSFLIGTFANFTITLNYFMLMVVMTAYAMRAYNAPESLAAFTASIFIIGTLFARLVSGAAMERVGRKRLSIIGAVFTIVFTALYLVGTDILLLLCIRFLHGFAYGIFSTCMATIVTAIVPPTRKGEGIGYYMLSVTLGAAIGPFVGILVSNHFDFRVLFIFAIAAAVIALILAALMRVPATKRSQTSLKAAKPTPTQAPQKLGLLDKIIEVGVLPIAGVAGLVYFGYSALLTFLTPFAETMDMTRAASVFFIVYAISMFITRPFTGKAFDRYGPRPVMIPAFLSFALSMAVLSATTNDWMLLGSALLAGFGVGTVQSCGLAMAVRVTSDTRLSLANSTFYIMLDLGVGVGPLLLGLLVPLSGYRLMYLCLSGLAIVAFLLFLLITKKGNMSQKAI